MKSRQNSVFNPSDNLLSFLKLENHKYSAIWKAKLPFRNHETPPQNSYFFSKNKPLFVIICGRKRLCMF